MRSPVPALLKNFCGQVVRDGLHSQFPVLGETCLDRRLSLDRAPAVAASDERERSDECEAGQQALHLPWDELISASLVTTGLLGSLVLLQHLQGSMLLIIGRELTR